MPSYNPNKHRRRSIRLKGYDYTQAGAYFVTICAKYSKCLFGEISDGEMVLNEYGIILQYTWEDLSNHYPHVQLDAWVIMPNHVHGVIVLTPNASETVVGAGLRPAPTTKRHGLPEIVRALKSFSARRINQRRHTRGQPVSQCTCYEHIIRSDRALNAIRTYIAQNPLRWELDRYNPTATGRDPQAKELWHLLQSEIPSKQDE